MGGQFSLQALARYAGLESNMAILSGQLASLLFCLSVLGMCISHLCTRYHCVVCSPITPEHVKNLIDNCPGDKLTGIYVQPSQRIFPDSQYEKAGAVITEDLSKADILLGVKRVADEDDLIPDKTYMFFSHVIKGQPENMGLLKV